MHFLDYFSPVKVIHFTKFFEIIENKNNNGKHASTLIASCSG